MKTQKKMPSKMRVVKAKELKEGFYVVTPKHPMGLLQVHRVDGVEIIDDGKWIEITVDNGRQYLLAPDDQVLTLS